MTPERPNLTIAAALGCLSALGPLAIDMYLPALPAMAADLAANEGSIQFSLMVFFTGLTLGQLIYGPLSDRLGRKPLIYFGLLLFSLASLACAYVTGFGGLLLARFIQGLGGSIGMVIALAVVRDLYTGQAAARLIALVLLVLGISPVLAPLAGSALLAFLGWRMIFFVLAAIGIVIFVFIAAALPETRMPELRQTSRPSRAFRQYLHLLTSRQFIPFVLVSAIAQGGFFAYISASASVFISIHGLSPTAYSILFALNAVGLVTSNQLSPVAMRRWGAYAVVRVAATTYSACGLLLLVMELAGFASLLSHCVLFMLVVASVGLIMPVLSVRAMASFGQISGTAAALLGAIQFIGAAVASGIVGSLANGTALPLVSMIAVCGVLALVIALRMFPVEQTPSSAH